MKRRRGPRQKSFPIPRTCAEGIITACYGNTASGCAEAIQLLISDDSLTKEERLTDFINRKTAAGGKPYKELARAEKALSTPEPVADKRRLIAMQLRLGCYHFGAPFSRGLLREWYSRRMPGNKISSSTLSRLFKWANAVRSLD